MGVLSVAGGILLAIAILVAFVFVIGLIVTYPEYTRQVSKPGNKVALNESGSYASESTKQLEQQVRTFNDCMNKTGDRGYCHDQQKK